MASIKLDAVSVDIPIYNSSNRSLKNNIISAATGGQIKVREGGRVSVRALDQVTLHIEHGARIALIGHNGSGKSTILRVMAGIYEPTGGRVAVEGQVAPLFDFGFGMDGDSTGWENIMLRGVLLGLSQSEVRERIDEIAAVSDLGEFFDMPIRTYSAGMVTRLAFAVSTSVKTDILLIDEGIGAGDAAFLERAKARMTTFIGEAGLLVLASHSDALIREWCDTAVWMEHGCIRQHGPIDDVIAAYHQSLHA
ncbi:MAG: ABC transporter ATP-binding protein [Rhizobiaceae bacterium]|nr:ABC transporter ATP-binding protein [Rhizobiaceae bacterium]